MAYYFSTSKYEWVHEKKPRGKGWWTFKVGGSDVEIDIHGLYTLSEAKRLVTAKLREMGVPTSTTIHVVP